MSPETTQQMRQELQIIERFSASYSQRFSQLIDELNGQPDSQTAWRCLRLCAEAVNMMLATQNHLAHALQQAESSATPAQTRNAA